MRRYPNRRLDAPRHVADGPDFNTAVATVASGGNLDGPFQGLGQVPTISLPWRKSFRAAASLLNKSEIANLKLADRLAVSDPLPEVTHLADVIGFVKR